MKTHKYQVEIAAEFYVTATSEEEAADKAMSIVRRNNDVLYIDSVRQTMLTVWNPPESDAKANGTRLDFSEAKLITPEINDEVPF